MSISKLNAYQTNLVETHIRLAQKLGLDAWRRSPDTMEKYEVIGIAYQGLLTAAVNFDPEWRPEDGDPNYDPFLAFGPYARRRITGAILDWQRVQDHVPKRQRALYKNLQQHGHGLGKTPEQLADITGEDVAKIRAVTQAVEATAISLDQPADSSGQSYGDVAASANVEDSALVSTIQDLVADTVNNLPALQRSVVVLRYYSGLDLSQIAAELGVGSSVVRSAHKEAIDLIHAKMRRAAS